MNRFIAGQASQRERRVIVRHLLTRCGLCAALLRSAFQPPVEADAYDDALGRLIEAVPAQAGCS